MLKIFHSKILKAILKGLYEGLSDYNLTMLDDDDSVIVKGKKAFDKNNVDYAEEDIINSNYNPLVIMEYYNSSNQAVKKMAEQYLYVDLGLTSGTKWRIANFGATCGDSAESWYGDYYQFAGLKPNNTGTWNTCQYIKTLSGQSFDNKLNIVISKYNNDEHTLDRDYKIHLDLSDDIVYKTTNGKECIPNKHIIEELTFETDYKTVKNFNNIENLNGIVVYSKKDNSKYIFIPSAGLYSENEYINNNMGMYLSSSIDKQNSINIWTAIVSYKHNLFICKRHKRNCSFPIRSIKNGR